MSNSAPESQAHNFVSGAQEGTDPRTGLFSWRFPLATLSARDNQAPFLPLALSWSPLRPDNRCGPGTGFSLGLTAFDDSVRPGRLTLSSGEQYRVDSTLSGELSLRQCPLPTFRLRRVTVPAGKKQIHLEHKDGNTEILEEQTPSVWLPVRIVAPTGRYLTLEWQASQGNTRLSAVKDGDGMTLCRFTWGDVPVITVWPGTGETLTLKLYIKNGYLTEIHNTSLPSEPLVWQLGWEDDEALRFPGDVSPLKSVITPAGLAHTVIWTADKMRYNTRYGEGALPVVTESRLSPGGGLPAQTVTYRYSADSRNPGDDDTVLDHNWLGYGAAFSDSEYDTDNDNLLSLSRPYHYWSEVSLKGAGSDPDTVVRRTYNRFHLMTEERTWLQGRDCVHTQSIQYYADESAPLVKQKPIWSFPHTVTQTWQQGSASRSETARSEYDEKTGNLLKQTAPDGTVTTMTYYPESGETGRCPADPHGFERCLKSRTVTPVHSVYGDEPVFREEYTYADIAVSAENRQQTVVMPRTVSSFVYLKESDPQAKTARNVTTFSYQDRDATARDFGRLAYQVSAFRNDASPAHPYETRETMTFTYDDVTHRQTRTVTVSAMKNAADPDFTMPVTTTSRTVSGLTGRLISQTDAAGNTVSYGYDELGRPETQTRHPENLLYRQTARISYLPKDAQNRQQIIHTDAMNRQQRTTFDALGNLLTREIQDMDGPQARVNDWLTVSEYRYDGRGQVLSATTADWLRHEGGGEGPLPALQTRTAFTTTPERDDWGQVTASAGSDGVTHHHVTDPVACTVTTWSTGTDGKDTPRTVQYYAPGSGYLKKVAVFATAQDVQHDTPYSTVTQDCDGAGRLRKSTDPLGNVTTFTYDVYGRVDTTTLPDGAVISKTYAPFSPAALPVSLRVTDPDTKQQTVQGIQRFDAAGRVVSTTTGKDESTGRTTTWQYEQHPAARPNVNRVTGPDGVTCTVESDPRLGNAITTETVQDGKGALPAVKQTFRYNTLTGQLMEAQEGSSVTRQTYRPSGAVLRREEQVDGGSMLKSLAVHSLAGRVQQVTGVDGSTRVFTRETQGPGAGRVSQVSDGKSLSVTLRYDALHRVSGWTATALKGGHTLTVDITPDEYGRESIRTLTHSNGEVRTLTQTWYISGQLKTRTLSRSLNHGQTETLRAETFSYDARRRLKEYQVAGSQLPRDAQGNAFVRQYFTFDALSNIRTCETTLDGAGHGEVITATYGYAAHDPCQLRSVTYDKTQYGHRNLTFSDADYDKAGRLLKDEAGRGLHYDAAGRLVRVDAAGSYGYDAMNRLAWQRVDRTQQLHRLYYRGSRLVNEWVSPQGQAQNPDKDTLIRLTGLSQSTSTGGNEGTLLTGTDAMGSLVTGHDGSTRDYAWGPYGQGSRTEHGSEKQAESVRGWNGERQDPVTGVTHLGNGYRACNPVLMRFHCPDSLSPFGAGGINPYAYCAGDPVNHTDPTGHLSWNGWLSIGLGILAVVVGVATLGLGAAGAISLGVLAAGMAVLDVASGALAIASGSLEEKDPALSSKLGWASLGVGLPSMVYGGVKLVQGGVSLMRQGGLYEQAVGNMLRAAHGGGAAGAGQTAAAAIQGARVAVATVAADGGRYPAEHPASLMHIYGENTFGGQNLTRCLRSPTQETSEPFSVVDESLRSYKMMGTTPRPKTRSDLRALYGSVPQTFYRGSQHSVLLPEGTMDERLVAAIKHTSRTSGSAGEIQSFTPNYHIASRFAGSADMVKTVNVNPGDIFMSTAEILDVHADRLIADKLILPGTVRAAIHRLFENESSFEKENEYFWIAKGL